MSLGSTISILIIYIARSDSETIRANYRIFYKELALEEYAILKALDEEFAKELLILFGGEDFK